MSAPAAVEPIVVARPDHPISRRNIAANAVKVLYRLHNGGFKAYLVGGAVRDLMLGRQPKDFDVGTDARPPEVRRLFRNSRIIGRRFRLAHVFFRDEIVEVSTFRRDPDPEAQKSAPGELLITDDNVFGSPREDAFRRDFTINALFYDISDFSVIDYVGGIDDLERRQVRAIGEAEVRFQEDPVRMLRACEMAGRLDFTIERESRLAIQRHRGEVEKASPARLTEEVIELLRCASATGVLRWMMDLGLLEIFLPEAYRLLSASRQGVGEFEAILPALDRKVAKGKRFSDAALLSVLLLPSVLLRRRDVEAVNRRPIRRRALRELTDEVLEPFLSRLSISRVRVEGIQRAILAFLRFGDRWRSAIDRVRFAGQPGFDDALDLLEILVEATGEGRRDLELWRQVRERRPAIPQRPAVHRRPRRRARRQRR